MQIKTANDKTIHLYINIKCKFSKIDYDTFKKFCYITTGKIK